MPYTSATPAKSARVLDPVGADHRHGFQAFLAGTDQKRVAEEYVSGAAQRLRLFVDAGAGDGGITRHLAGHFRRTIAIEPSAADGLTSAGPNPRSTEDSWCHTVVDRDNTATTRTLPRLLLLGALPALLCGCVAVRSPSQPAQVAGQFGPSATPGPARSARVLSGEGTPPAAVPFVRITAPATTTPHGAPVVQHPDAPGPSGPPASVEAPRRQRPLSPQSSQGPAPHRRREGRPPEPPGPPANARPGYLCDQAEESGQLPPGLAPSCRQMFGH
ncbi:hypothetical protein ACWGCW_03685 [Streptomyces sp. NPDC054933]